MDDPHDTELFKLGQVTKWPGELKGEVKKGCQHNLFRTVVTCCECEKVLRDETLRTGMTFIMGGLDG